MRTLSSFLIIALSMVGVANADVIFEDDFESYDVGDPANFGGDLFPVWEWNGVGIPPNASRIFQTGNFGGTRLWIADAANANAGTGINSRETITLDADADLVFSAALVTETFNGLRTATGTVDLLINGNSLIGGPQAFEARGDHDDSIPGSIDDSFEDQITTINFNSGPGGDLEIRIAFDFADATNPFVGVDNVIISCPTDCLLGDVNLDGAVDLLDVQPFVAAITSGKFQCEADVNQDGVVDLLDVSPFVDLLSGG